MTWTDYKVIIFLNGDAWTLPETYKALHLAEREANIFGEQGFQYSVIERKHTSATSETVVKSTLNSHLNFKEC